MLLGLNSRERVRKDLEAMFYWYVSESDDLIELFSVWCMSPEKIGGLGAAPAICEFLSGGSDGTHKTLHYLESLIRLSFKRPDDAIRIMENALNPPIFRQSISIDENYDKSIEVRRKAIHEITDSPFVYFRQRKTAKSIILKSIRKGVTRSCRNKRMLALLSLSSSVTLFKQNIVAILKDSYHYRTANFYISNSRYHVLDKLLMKLESSEAFHKLVGRAELTIMCQQLFKSGAEACGKRLLLRDIKLVSRLPGELRSKTFLLDLEKNHPHASAPDLNNC
jgi:hypothetical protein